MKTKYTSGLWEVIADPDHFDTLSTVIGGEVTNKWPGRRLIIQVGGSCSIKEQEANARLIAAAPELLEALKIVSNDLAFEVESKGLNPSQDWRILLARSAIAKATGEKLK